MNEIEPQCAWALGATLGEGPVWHAGEAAVYFVDIKSRKLHRYRAEGGATQSWDAPAPIGFALPHADGSLLCGLQGGLHRFFPDEGRFERIVEVEPETPGNRLNDGYVDPQGNLWFGSMDDRETEASGVLYRVGADGAVTARDRGYIVTNGPAMSPDARTLYHCDTLGRTVYAFDVDREGTLERKRVFAQIDGGYPDGMAVDVDGFVWIGIFGGARLDRFEPDGRLAGSVRLPCPNVTKLAFGGDDARTAYVTTARVGMSDDALERAPLAGGLFSFRAPAAGLPVTPCRVLSR